MTLDMDYVWLNTFHEASLTGEVLSPRGLKIKELQHHTIEVDMNYPVLTWPGRKLNYRFMAAEAAWILSGRDKLDYLVQYNPNMAEFSDDGVTLAGAYGPKIVDQLSYVVRKLWDDRDTRQATLTIWEPNPAPSKDIPCTVAMDFKIRHDRLNCHVFMRSSDIWLGLPYDVFTFTMIACEVLTRYHCNKAVCKTVKLGTLYLTAASSHLYEPRWAEEVPQSVSWEIGFAVPEDYWDGHPGFSLTAALTDLADTKKGDEARWWEL